MAHSLTWLAAVLKAAGLKVAEVSGWENRGRGDVGTIRGVICHHTAGPGPNSGNMPSLNVVINGHGGLPGPLSQLCLGRDGTYFVVAAGRCNHAGPGNWRGNTNGNANFIGIEAENSGKAGDPWPEVQMDAYRRGVATILRHIGQTEIMCAGHKEYRLPKGFKVDPSFDMDAFRASVKSILDGTTPAPTLIPRVEPSPSLGAVGRPTLRRGSNGDLVKVVQKKVEINDDGDFGPITEAAVRVFQRAHNLVPDGIVGPRTWAALDLVE